MTMNRKVAIILGSARRDSNSSLIFQALEQISTKEILLSICRCNDLPLFNPDLDDEPPIEWSRFRFGVAAADAVLFITPEHNRSVPALLKNAIDVGSRPYGSSVWARKPAGIITHSPGAIGGFGANHHLRQCLVFLDMPVMQQPEAYLSRVHELFQVERTPSAAQIYSFLVEWIQAFASFIHQNTQNRSNHALPAS